MTTATTSGPAPSAAVRRAIKAVRYIRARDCDFLTVENVADYAQLHAVGDDDAIRGALNVEMGIVWYQRMVAAELGQRGWDLIDGQTTVAMMPAPGDRPRVFAVVSGRRWTRVHEYLTNGQLTARWFVDENTGEARMAEGARKPKAWPMSARAQAFARSVVQLARAM